MKRVVVGAVMMTLMAVAAPVLAEPVRADETNALMALDLAAGLTLEQSAAGISLEFFTEEANQFSFTTAFAATPARYDEDIRVGNGKRARVGVSDEGRGYVTANLIPLPPEILAGAGLVPDSLVAFRLDRDPIGGLQEMARMPAQKLTEYVAYSPAGMWEGLAKRAAHGEVVLFPVATTPTDDAGARYQIEVSAPLDPVNAFLFTAEVGPDGLLRHAQAKAPGFYLMESRLISVGADTTVPAAPTFSRPWAHIEAAQWRARLQDRVTRFGQQAVQRTEARARAAGKPPTVALVREQTRLVARDATITDATVKPWNIRSGARIEVRRKGTTGHIWTVGVCVTVHNRTVTATPC